MASDNAALVAAYWRVYRLSQGSREDRLLAESEAATTVEVTERISGDPAAALTLLDNLLASEGADLHFFAAGPLEDLLVTHGAKVAQAVADRCARSPDWREAVRAVWLDDQEWAALTPLHPLLPQRK
jgi:hypothetical protein